MFPIIGMCRLISGKNETMYRNGEHKLKRLVFPLVYIVRKF
jgi:hypothetical protein